MFDFVEYGAAQVETFLLVILRAAGIFIVAPVFGHRSVPALVKVGVLICLGVALVPTISTSALAPTGSIWQLSGLAAKEILIGVLIGLVFQLLFMGAKTAGSVIGYQMGFALVSMPDVEEGGQITILGSFWYVVALLIFLTIDGHHLVLTAFADSYEAIPPGAAALPASVAELVIGYTAYVFVIALKMAAPVMITLFLTDVALGTIAKTMPTMNVFFVGFPVKIGVGLMVMALSLPVFSFVLRRGMLYLDGELRLMLAAMGKV